MLKDKYIEDVPPNDKELERLLLGVLIIQPKYINTASIDLFYPEANQQIFAKMAELHRKKIQISEPLLVHHLSHILPSHIASLTDGVYKLSGEQINAIVRQLKNLRTKRRLRVQVYQLYDALGKGQDMEAAQELIDKMKKEGDIRTRSGKPLDNSPGDLFDQQFSVAPDQLQGNDGEDGRDVDPS